MTPGRIIGIISGDILAPGIMEIDALLHIEQADVGKFSDSLSD